MISKLELDTDSNCYFQLTMREEGRFFPRKWQTFLEDFELNFMRKSLKNVTGIKSAQSSEVHSLDETNMAIRN